MKIIGDWKDVKNACRVTSGKEPTDKAARDKFKADLVLSEHSPIRKIHVSWEWTMPYWVAMEWARHKFEKFITSQRTDRTNVLRDKKPQDVPVTFEGYANVQSLIDAWRKRLCNLATKEAKSYAVQFKRVITRIAPEIGNALVPNCIYRGGCPEMKNCGYYKAFCDLYRNVDLTSIRERYDAYNGNNFYKNGGKQNAD